jgi:hypothetical protein
MDLKNIISKKAHESSLKTLKNVPPAIHEKLTFEFIESIARVLSTITRDEFRYTGKIIQDTETLRLTFTSSSQKDSIDLLITFKNEGYEFVNLNQKLEKIIDKPAETPQIVQPVQIPQKVVPKKKKIVKKQAINKDETNNLLNLALTNFKQEEEQKKKEEVDKLTNALMGALTKLEVWEDVKQKEQIIEELLKKETNGD